MNDRIKQSRKSGAIWRVRRRAEAAEKRERELREALAEFKEHDRRQFEVLQEIKAAMTLDPRCPIAHFRLRIDAALALPEDKQP